MMSILAKIFGVRDSAKPASRKSPSRNYTAAASKARYGDFTALSSGSADYELRGALRTLRNKSRFLARNSSSIRRYLQLLKVNVVGPDGFVFQCRVRKLDGSLDEGLNDRVKMAHDEWANDSVTVDGEMSLLDLMHQAIYSLPVDGEVLWEIVRNPRYPDGIAINPIEADLLDETLNTVYPQTGNQIIMGVEVDAATRRRVAYHFLSDHPGDSSWLGTNSRNRYRRVSADNVIHIFERQRPGQTRGEPWTVTTVNSIKMLDGYREAETVGRRLRSAIMGFFVQRESTSGGISEMADRDDEEDQIYEMDIEPGTIKSAPKGYEFDKFDPGGSQTDYADFEMQIKKDISMGLGISTLSHGMETASISYSTARTVVIEDRDSYRVIQSFIKRRGLKPLFIHWLGSHILREESVIPPSRRLEIIRKSIYRPRGWDWVDPAKDVKSNSDALATMQTSHARIAASRGIDRDDLFDEIEEDMKAAKKRGLTLNYTQSSHSSDAGEEEDDKPEAQ
jgi:lambda family phage portal protein